MRPTLVLLAVLAVTACDRARPTPEASADSAGANEVPPADSSVAERVDPIVARWLGRVDSTVFTRWGACPFECCVYREWLAQQPVRVRAAPNSGSAIVATIPAGGRFEADTGFVRVTSAQLVIVSDTVEAYRIASTGRGGQPDSLAPGDTVLVLDYVGEGHYQLTDGRHVYSTEQFWPGPDDWQPYGGARGRTVGSHAAEWWAQVTTADGTRGWIDAYASELGNVDACGVPE